MNIFKFFKKQNRENTVVTECIDYAKKHEEEYQKSKREWESNNELLKKFDACSLGTSNKAFYGTYEEWNCKKNAELFASFAPTMLPNQLAQQQMNSYYRNQVVPYNGNPWRIIQF